MSTAAEVPVGRRQRGFVAVVTALVVAAPLAGLWWMDRATVDAAVREVGGRFHTAEDTGTWIDLSNSRVDDAWLNAQRENIKGLKSVVLSLEDVRITGAGLAAVAGMQNVVRLDLAGTRLADADMQQLASMEKLQVLNIGRTGASDAGLKVLARLPRLETLTIDRTQATPQGAAALARCAKLRGLTLLDADAQSVTAVQGLRLLGLQLRGEGLDASCLPVLTQFTGLMNLTLYDSRFSDAELEGLRQALPDCTVDQVDYSTVEESIAAAWKQRGQ